MFKLMAKLEEHWNAKLLKNGWYFLVLLLEVVLFVALLLGLSCIIAFSLRQTDYFSAIDYIDLCSAIFGALILFVVVIGIAYLAYLGEKRDK